MVSIIIYLIGFKIMYNLLNIILGIELFILFLPFPIKAKFLVPILILGDLFFGFSSYSVGPIAHFAHIGGALTGFLIMWYWKKNQFNKNRWDL